jgi:hypothetical protein
MNLCQIVTKAASRWHDPTFNVISTDQWCDYVNEAMRLVQAETPFWPWLESAPVSITFAAAQASADLPADSYTINWGYNTTVDEKMYPDEGRGSQWHASRQQIDTTGIPRTYKARGAAGTAEGAATGDHGCVDVYPIPDSTYVLKFEVMQYNPVLDAATNCIPPFPTVFHSMLIDGALAFAALDDDDLPGYSAKLTAFCAEIHSLEWSMAAARNETNPPIRDSFWL